MRRRDEFPDALAALSVPTEATPGGVSRRRFLAGLGGTALVASLAGPSALRSMRADAQSTGDRNLVVLMLGGGNDGFATVMPTGASALDQLRPSLLPAKSSLRPLGDGFGLHPSLTRLHAMHQAGQVAVVGGVGAFGRLSHFETTADWMAGTPTPTTALPATGWLGRWLDAMHADAGPAPLRGVSVASTVPVLMVGSTTGATGIGLGGIPILGSQRRNVSEQELFAMVEGWANLPTTTAAGVAGRVAATAADTAERVGPIVTQPAPTDYGVAQTTVAARLLNDGDLGTRVVFCTLGGYDVHASEAFGQNLLMLQLDKAVGALFDTLAPAVAARTTLLVFSEFGRRAAVNGSAGTDHGTASYAFVVGPPVRGGMRGAHLDPTRLDARGNPPTTVRHLDLIGSVLGPWLGGDAAGILGTSYTDLQLFR